MTFAVVSKAQILDLVSGKQALFIHSWLLASHQFLEAGQETSN